MIFIKRLCNDHVPISRKFHKTRTPDHHISLAPDGSFKQMITRMRTFATVHIFFINAIKSNIYLLNVIPGLDASQEDDGLLCLVVLLNFVRDYQGELWYFLDHVSCKN